MSAPDPGPNTTLRTSVAGIVASLISIGVVASFLVTGRHISAEALGALAILPTAVGSLCGNVGSLLAKRAGRKSVQQLAAATADHVLGATGSMRAAEAVLDSVGAVPAGAEGTKT